MILSYDLAISYLEGMEMERRICMNKNLAFIVLISNFLFYIGIFGVIYLFGAEDNTYKWLIAILCIVVGMVGSAIPDAMINLGMGEISLGLVRGSLIIKYVIFLICFTFLSILTIPTIMGILVLLIVDLLVEILLLKQIYNKHVTAQIFITKLRAFDTSAIDSVFKYFLFQIFGIFLFLNIHENFIECILMLIVCVLLHIYTSEKLLGKINFEITNTRWKIRCVLWCLEVLMLILAYFEKTLVVSAVFANYYTIATDLIMPRRTSLFHKKN